MDSDNYAMHRLLLLFLLFLLIKLIDQQECSDSVLHEARILSRHFATAQCPDKKAGAADIPNSSQANLLQTLNQTRAKGAKGT
jgi:hypothetical protein